MTVLDRMPADELASRITNGPTGYSGVVGDEEWAAEVRRLATQRGATLLAHNYQLPAIQDVADHVGDSLALSRITADELRAWKAEYPGAVVVSYVNTTAAVKAETDICCTSSNAVEVVASIPEDREVLFCPVQSLGAHVRRITGRANMHIWAGECHVHAGIN